MRDQWSNVIEPSMQRHQMILNALQSLETDPEPSLWIFGYGSLIWNPGFQHEIAIRGFVDGMSRKFWQGNSTYRGTRELPGRVVTLTQEPGERACGLVFKVTGSAAIAAALEHLHVREIESGYHYDIVQVQCLDPISDINSQSPSLVLDALTCIAPPGNPFFLGPTQRMDSDAWQIAHAFGPAGSNAEYLLKLAQSMRFHFPDADDSHLFRLEQRVLDFLRKAKADHQLRDIPPGA